MNKEDKNLREESKKRTEMSFEQEAVEMAMERTSIIEAYGSMPPQSKPKKRKHMHNRKRGYHRVINKRFKSGNIRVCYRHF
jgi:hypothetical protein